MSACSLLKLPPHNNTQTASVLASNLNVNLANVIAQIVEAFGNTTYEELGCIGLDTNTGALVGVIKLKLPSGYSGNLCSAGSLEYVAFWVDWNDGAGWTYAGYSAVKVYEITKIPPEVDYAISLPIDLSTKRRPCQDGPKTAKVRAVLSWNENPPASNPDFEPNWGNRKETTIHIPPGPTTGIDLPDPPLPITTPHYPVPLSDGMWQLATAGMKPCGYVIRLGVYDRTIVNSGYIGWYAEDTAGFCLEANQASPQ